MGSFLHSSSPAGLLFYCFLIATAMWWKREEPTRNFRRSTNVADNIISIGVTVDAAQAKAALSALQGSMEAFTAKFGEKVSGAAKEAEGSTSKMQTLVKGVMGALAKHFKDAGKDAEEST